ncbi:tandem-95 repeat protein [Vibrio plantisponsor]|uniref:VCBS domain-containing protein n=1 Tax=Vibrio plantisponsor TaxID=664643 RepID=UPI001489B1AC|nr:VCBS domain-containing protein [Vibrio plantisponsor]NNM40899.1 tandem-95 repeat protein [Vibrio plantisponsor]
MREKKTENSSNKKASASETPSINKRDDKARFKAKELDKKAALLKAQQFRTSNLESDFNSDLVADKSWHTAHAQATAKEATESSELLDESVTATSSEPSSPNADRSAIAEDEIALSATDDSQAKDNTGAENISNHRGGNHVIVELKESITGDLDPLKQSMGNNFKSALVAPSDLNKAEPTVNTLQAPPATHSAHHSPQASNSSAQHTLAINHLPPAQLVKEDASVSTVDGQLTASGDGSLSVSWSVASTHGKYGDLQLDSKTGEWHYHLDNHLADTDQLGEGEVHTEHFTVTATDKFGHVIHTEILVNVEGTNDAPKVSHTVVDEVVDQGAILQFTLSADTFSDIDHGDTLTLSTGTLPAWLHFDASTGTFSGTPTNSDVGQTRITVTATDNHGAHVSTTFDLTVNNVNDAPVLTPMATVKVDEDGASVQGQIHATDIDTGDTLTFSAGQVDGFTFHSDGSWTFDPSHSAYQHLAVGETLPLSIPVTVTDSHGASDVQQLNIVVSGTNDAPTVTSSITLPEGSEDTSVLISASSLLANATDIDSGETQQLTVQHLHADHGSIVDNHDGTFTVNPDANYNGRVTFTYNVQDPQGATVATSATMDLKAVGDAAIITGQDTGHVTEDLYDATQTQNLMAWGQLTVTDPDKGEAGFVEHITGLARFAKPDFVSGQYGRVEISEDGHWTYMVPNSHPDVQSLGVGQHLTDHIEVESLDGTKHTITITIDGTNDAPTVTHTVANQTVDQSATLQFRLPADTFSDIDHGDTLTLSTGTLPAWLHFDASTGTFSGTPTNSDVGQTRITVTATDNHGAHVSTTFDLTVNNVNDAPVLTPMATVKVDEDGASVQGQIHATDIDTGDTLTFSAGQVDGFTFHSDGSWTFDPSHSAYQHLAVGETLPLSIPVTVTDSHGASDVQLLNILVTGTNDAPVLSIQPFDNTSGHLTEVDVDSSDTHQFSVVQSSGSYGDLIVNSQTGEYNYVPRASVAGMSYDSTTNTYSGSDVFEVRVTDNHGAESTKFITFNVQSILTPTSATGYQVHSHVTAPPQLTAASPSVHMSSLPLTNDVTLELETTSDTGMSDQDHLTRDNTPTVHGTSEIPFSVIEIHEGNSLIATVVSDASGHYRADLPHMIDATHSLFAIAVSPSSISGTSVPLDLTVDTQSELHVNPIAGDNILDAVEHTHLLTIDGTANGIEDGQIITVSIGGNNHQAVVSNGLWSVDIDATEVQSLTGGLHDVLVSAEDRAGNAVSSNIPLFVSDASTPVPSMSFQTPPTPTGGGSIGSHISGTILIPPLLQQLSPQASGSGGWGIDDGHGHTVTSLQGDYGTLTIDPVSGHVEYIYNTAPIQSVKATGGTHVAGQTTTEEHHDIFKVVYHDVHASDIDVKVDLDVTYIHGHSGHNQLSTHLVDMTLIPATPSSAPPVQHDEVIDGIVPDEFTVEILDDAHNSDMNLPFDGTHQLDQATKPIDHYLDMVGVSNSHVSASDNLPLSNNLPSISEAIDSSLDDNGYSHTEDGLPHDPLVDSKDERYDEKHLPDSLDAHQSDSSHTDDLLHQGLSDMHNHI